jgi:hypothetical protein
MNPTPRRYLRALHDRGGRALSNDSPSGAGSQPESRFKSPRRIESAEPEQMPDELREEMWQAAELWHTLHAEGKRLHYEIDEPTGRVTVELRDFGGAVRRPVSLVHALGASDDGCPAA